MICFNQETAAAEHATWNLLIYMWSQENEFPHARVIYFRLCAIYAQAGCFVWCAWLLVSKVNLNWKKFSYFDPHDYHVMIIYKPVTSCIYISVGCLMTPSLVWLMSPWLTGCKGWELLFHKNVIGHRFLIVPATLYLNLATVNHLLASLKLVLFYKLNWLKRASAVY